MSGVLPLMAVVKTTKNQNQSSTGLPKMTGDTSYYTGGEATDVIDEMLRV